MSNRYKYGTYTGLGIDYDFKDKDTNIRNYVLYMLNRSLLMFEYDNLPETIPVRDLERMLQTRGYSYITEVEGELYALWGGLGGEMNAYYRPTEINISNPHLNFNKTLSVENDGVLISNDDMLLGLIPMYSRYCTMLVETDITMILANVNKRIDNLISVSDDNTAESARIYFKKVMDGELGYIFENKLYDSLKYNPNSNSKTVHLQDLVEFTQYMKASMYNEIGLSANHQMKKERLITKELEDTNAMYPLVDNMLNNRKQAIEKINQMYGTNITVELSSSWRYRDGEYAKDVIENSDDTGLLYDDLEGSNDEVIENHDEDIETSVNEDMEVVEDTETVEVIETENEDAELEDVS